jgi:hypothetical protein
MYKKFWKSDYENLFYGNFKTVGDFFYPVNRFSTRRSAPNFMKDTFYFRKFHSEGTLNRSFFDILNSFYTWREKLPKIYEKPLKTVIKKTDRSAGASRSAVVEVCPSSLRSSDWVVYYYYIRFECNNCIRKKTILSGASV